MLLSTMATPTSLLVTAWSLRSVPIAMLILMFVFNSGSIQSPNPNLHFWIDAIAITGIIGIITYWNSLNRLQWNVSFTIYLYIFLALILRNPYGVLNTIAPTKMAMVDYPSIFNSMWVGISIFGIGMLLEILIFHLRQFKRWAWWLALSISILYVASIVFFFSGTLGIWSLLDAETKQAFKQKLRIAKISGGR
jgi:hypothetical protein